LRRGEFAASERIAGFAGEASGAEVENHRVRRAPVLVIITFSVSIAMDDAGSVSAGKSVEHLSHQMHRFSHRELALRAECVPQRQAGHENSKTA